MPAYAIGHTTDVREAAGIDCQGVRDLRKSEFATEGFSIDLVVGEGVGETMVERARDVLLDVARVASRPVLHVRIVLGVHHDPARERPAVAKASLDVSGRLVRAHVTAEQMPEAIDLLERRLRRNLKAVDDLVRAHRHETGVALPGEWRHGSLRTDRPEYFPRAVEERELIRRKTFALSTLTPDEAALEMDMLDHAFHLFTNADSGEENVVHRDPAGAISLATISPAAVEAAATIPVDPVSASVMLFDDAIERLNLTGERFVFYVDAQTRRGTVLYLRYDGHYGLIEPA